MIHKILCPTDFSEGSEQALRVAARLAIERGAELDIVHAWHLPAFALAGETPLGPRIVEEAMTAARRKLALTGARARDLGVDRVQTQLLTGVAWHEIVELVSRDRAFDLVVMGTQGRTGLARVLLGSVTEKVVRHAPCSVLAVRATDRGGAFSRILCPIDTSECSRDAVIAAGALATANGVEITLLHVVEVPDSYAAEPGMTDFLATMDVLATRMLEQERARLAVGSSVAITTRVERGSPIARTLAVLDEKPFDLVVVGSHGRTGIRRVMLGSVAERLVRHANCPVLVARTRPAA